MHPVDGPPRWGAQDRDVGQIQQMHTGRATGLIDGGIDHPHPALHGADQARGQPKHLGRVVQAAEQHLGVKPDRATSFRPISKLARRASPTWPSCRSSTSRTRAPGVASDARWPFGRESVNSATHVCDGATRSPTPSPHVKLSPRATTEVTRAHVVAAGARRGNPRPCWTS